MFMLDFYAFMQELMARIRHIRAIDSVPNVVTLIHGRLHGVLCLVEFCSLDPRTRSPAFLPKF